MKTTLLFTALLTITSVLFFFAPHHRRTPNRFNACTLGEIYREFFQDMPEIASPRLSLFLFLGVAGIATSFYPALWTLAVRLCPSAGGWFIMGGLVAAAGAIANWFAMLISHTSFTWGASQSARDETAFFWIIPLFQLTFAAASIAMGSSDSFANGLSRWLTR